MRFGLLLTMLSLVPALAVPPRALAQSVDGGPFADVPLAARAIGATRQWAYDAIEQLAQRGLFTGCPNGTFSGKRALTRHDFAGAVQTMVRDVELQMQLKGFRPPDGSDPANLPGARTAVPHPRDYGWEPPLALRRHDIPTRNDLTLLQKLVREFATELTAHGSDVSQDERNLQAVRRWMKRQRPPRVGR